MIFDDSKILSLVGSVAQMRLAAGAVFLNNCRILLLRRAASESLPGLYELPSGHVENGESVESALKREAFEETGLLISKIDRFVGAFIYSQSDHEPVLQLNYQVLAERLDNVTLSDEHDAFAWHGPETPVLHLDAEFHRHIEDIQTLLGLRRAT
jgi:8-oxo-dGTP diphosphatase